MRGRRPTPAEIALWHESQRQTRPLKGPRKPPTPKTPPPIPPPPPPKVTAARPPARPAAPAAKPKPKLQELSHGRMSGVDKRRAERLRRGRLPIEARLDLHGMTQARAHASLIRFIEGSIASGLRCVLVVTGIGRMSERPVLREGVPRWLNEPALRAHVLGFDHAQIKDGGLGALYVLLKRRRET